jgi:hypothetical protein
MAQLTWLWSKRGFESLAMFSAHSRLVNATRGEERQRLALPLFLTSLSISKLNFNILLNPITITQMNHNEIRRRLLFIIDDASRLLSHLEQGGDMDEFTGFADDGYTHLYNIQIAADLNDTESKAWGKAMSMDADSMELVIRYFNKNIKINSYGI